MIIVILKWVSACAIMLLALAMAASGHRQPTTRDEETFSLCFAMVIGLGALALVASA